MQPKRQSTAPARIRHESAAGDAAATSKPLRATSARLVVLSSTPASPSDACISTGRRFDALGATPGFCPVRAHAHSNIGGAMLPSLCFQGVPPRAPRLRAPSTRTRQKFSAKIAALGEIRAPGRKLLAGRRIRAVFLLLAMVARHGSKSGVRLAEIVT